MAYKPTPKTSYGDTDFSDDTWTPSQGGAPIQQPPAPPSYYGAPPPPPPPPGHYPGMTQQQMPAAATGMGQLPYRAGSQQPQYGGPMQQGQPGQPTNPITAIAGSITQEDILFMRSWQRDSFYYRVIPISALGLGSMYMYNRTKGLPHSIPKYLAVASVAFLFGKWTYKNEFKRRLAESPSSTPYMQAMRRTLGITPVTSEFSDSMYGGANSDQLDPWNSADNTTGSSSDDRRFGSMGLQSSSGNTNYDLSNASDRLDNQQQTNDEATTAKPRVSYDELRARNRGFMK